MKLDPGGAPTGFVRFDDVPAIRTRIYDRTLAAARALEPVENSRHRLELTDVDYDGPADFSKADQKRAILEGGTLGRRLKGTMTLTDKLTGEQVARKRTTLAEVPYFGPRGTFTMNGSAYSMASQMRLRPGVFTRRKSSGELESHVNVLPGQGASHRVYLEPETGLFRAKFGQGLIPLASVLKAQGVTDDQLKSAWGPLASANIRKAGDRDVEKLYERLVGKIPPEDGNKAKAVAAALANSPLDPEVTSRTLGHGHDRLTPEVYLAITRRLLAISKGDEESDDRDNLAFMTIHGPDDLISERVGLGKGALKRALFKATARGNLDHVAPGILSPAVRAALTGSGLAQPGEFTNPMSILEQMSKVTRLGEGGIPGDAVPEESRSVQPSQLGFVDFLATPESMAVGVDSRMAHGALRGNDGRVYAPMKDIRTGEVVHRSPQELYDATIAFPGELDSEKTHIPALQRGQLRFVHRDKVDYELPSMDDALAPVTNLVPMKSGVKGQRTVMGARMAAQALSLVDAEAPLVQSGTPDGDDDSFERRLGVHAGAVRASQGGHVVSVAPDKVVIRHDDGTDDEIELDNNLPNNRKTYFHQTPTVQAGQRVEAGHLLARSNFTDGEGTLALGKNSRVVYAPYDGKAYEDAFVVSRSYADRMKSQHAYQHTLEPDDGTEIGVKAHLAAFPGVFSRKQLETFDDQGIKKAGSVVEYGDPLVVAVGRRPQTQDRLHGGGRTAVDRSVTWEHHAPGLVTDAVRTREGGVNVVVSTELPMQLADKISGRHGDKGVLGAIVEDREMLHDAEGRPFDIAINPLGLLTRSNPSQAIEAALGKIAMKTGRPYRVKDFGRIPDLTEYASQELKKHGMSDREVVIDPRTGRKVVDPSTGKDPMTGVRFFMKLLHTSESKIQGRGTGAYDADEAPAKGGVNGSKRLSLLESSALLSHGATGLISDGRLVRGQAHPEFWDRFMAGHAPPEPKVPKVYEKFLATMTAAGINPVRSGSKINLMALTDKDVDELAGGRSLLHAQTVDMKNGLAPVPGGLFDKALTGSHGGDRWSKIDLAEPILNPVFEKPALKLLDLTEKKFRDVMAGRETLAGLSGPKAISAALSAVDVPRALAQARHDVANRRGASRDDAVRKLGYLKSADALGIHPRDWVLSKAPVLPPRYRPVSLMQGSGTPIVADANYLYRELFDADKQVRTMREKVADVGDEHLALYDAFKGVAGLGDPLQPKNQEKGVKGMLRQVFGPGSPKFGMVQRRLLSGPMEGVGRAVIVPDPDLGMDEIGIPETRAWDVYGPHLVRHMVRKGMPRLQAKLAVTDQTQGARAALLEVMKERPVVASRAPILHRYGAMAFWPRLVKGDAIRMTPTSTPGFGADFDGDQMNYYVPFTDHAVRDAVDKMLPSRNLFSVARFKADNFLPSKEFAGGLYQASTARDASKPARSYATVKAALAAYRRGEIGAQDPIEIHEDHTGEDDS